MKFLLSVIAGIIVCYFSLMYLPIWWLFAIATFLIAVIIRLRTGWWHFLSGFLSVFIAWMILFYKADAPNKSILSDKIAALFSMPGHHLLFVVASVAVGLAGGLAAVTGSALRRKK